MADVPSTVGNWIVTAWTAVATTSVGLLSIFFIFAWPNDLLTSSTNNPCGSSNISYATFDYIVVGSGAAGSVIASKLSANPNITVLLIEAGTDPSQLSNDPSLYRFIPYDASKQVYEYHADIVNTSGNSFENGIPMQPGKMLGGTTGNNDMTYVCGTDQDWNLMAITTINPLVNYVAMLAFRTLMEKNLDLTKINSQPYHSIVGPVMVTPSINTNAFAGTIASAYQQMGYAPVADFNQNVGYSGIVSPQFTISGGKRCSAARAYLQFGKSNLFIMKNTVVTKVVFNAQNVTTGVIVSTQNSSCPTMQLYVRKEVILSAGALNTPKILLQSGVGKAADLLPLQIAPIGANPELPVGENLQDHPCGITFVAYNASTSILPSFFSEALGHLVAATGLYSSLGPLNTQLFVNLGNSSAMYPDIQVLVETYPKNFSWLTNLTASIGLKNEAHSVLQEYNQNYDILMISTCLLNPLSAGTVKLKSSSPSDTPKIKTGYFTDTLGSDANKMIAAFKLVQKFLQTSTMSALSPTIIPFNFTNCQNESYSFWSTEFLSCYLTYFTTSGMDLTGTAKMGHSLDPTAVVDSLTFSVLGVKKLRVVDASIFPSVFTGNMQCPTYILAEYASVIIAATSD